MTRSRQRRALAVAAAVVAALAVVAPPTSAAPVSYQTAPIATGWSTNGTVLDLLVVGDTVYAGGTFTAVRPTSGGPAVPRARLAAFDIHTGALVEGFVASANDAVRALASDGTRLFVGGSFTSVNGQGASRVAAVDLASGTVASGFRADASSHVYVLERAGDRLYVGGAFGALNGAPRSRLAAVSTTTGAVDATFRPDANGHVRGLAASPDGATVYAGGQFTTIGGGSRSYLAALSASDGALLPLAFQHSHYGRVLELDLSPSGDQLVAALGDLENAAIAWSTITGQRQWVRSADGDTQAVRYHEGNVYFGFHEGYGGSTDVRVLAADAETGELEPAFRPTVNSFYGVWAIDGHADALVLGGEFTMVEGVPVQGIAILPRAGAPPDDPPPPPEDPPDPPGEPSEAVLVPRGAVWRYTDDGLDRGSAWSAPGYDDASWSSGPAQLGYGDGDEATVLDRGGPAVADRYLQHHLRHTFALDDPAEVTGLRLELLRDDGVVVHLNGTEVLRENMPAGPVGPSTYATAGVWGAEESTYHVVDLPADLLVAGSNVVAVSLHNESRSGSDLSFDASLVAELTEDPSDPPEDPTDPPEDPTDPPEDPTDPPGDPTDPVEEALVARGGLWRYTEDGLDRGTGWTATSYDDSGWPTGPAQLGYGDGDEATVLYRGGPTVADRYLQHHLRHRFTVSDVASITALTLELLRDDGVVVHLNGTEVLRDNMPAGPVGPRTYPTAGVWGTEESTFRTWSIPPGLLIEGSNVLAVSLHNESRSSSDLSFDAALVARRG